MARTWLLNACLPVSLLILVVVIPCTAALQLDEKSNLIKRLTDRDPEDLAVSKRSYPWSPIRCESYEVLCADKKQCVHKTFFCDGYTTDCRDRSDEQGCETKECPWGRRKCKDGKQCIDSNGRCDGVNECKDRSDEHKCGCPGDQKQCDDGFQCIPWSKLCNFEKDCWDDSDENEQYCSDHCDRSDDRCLRLIRRVDGRGR